MLFKWRANNISNSMIETVNVLGLPIYAKNMDLATQLLTDTCLQEKKLNRTISATGAHGTVYAQSEPTFFQTLKNFTINLPDGKPLVWVGRLKQASGMEQVTGPYFFKNVIKKTADKPIRHFFCGGKEGVAASLAEVCEREFGNPNICGVYCPPFLSVEEYNYAEIANHINEAKADVVWIGLSTPKQELFASRLKEFTDVHFIATVGAAFDFHTGGIKMSPAFVSRIGMEWFYRLCQEPKRLWRRYATIVPLFLLYNFREFLSFGNKSA